MRKLYRITYANFYRKLKRVGHPLAIAGQSRTEKNFITHLKRYKYMKKALAEDALGGKQRAGVIRRMKKQKDFIKSYRKKHNLPGWYE